jgi:acetolactate synthase-1/3 small subunit
VSDRGSRSESNEHRVERAGWCCRTSTTAVGRFGTRLFIHSSRQIASIHISALFKVPVWAVLDYTNTRVIERELLLVKVSILGPEYLDEQLKGGPSHDPRKSPEMPHPADGHTTFEHELIPAHNFQTKNHLNSVPEPASPAPLSPSEALRSKYQLLQSIHVLASQFGAQIADVSEHSVIVELTAKSNRVDAFLSLLRPFGVLESARTGQELLLTFIFAVPDPQLCFRRILGMMAMPRAPIAALMEEEQASETEEMDSSLLPPG